MLLTPMNSALTLAGLLSVTLALAPRGAHAEVKPTAAPADPAPPPKSLFVIDPATSKDPFYPKTERFKVILKTNDPTVAVYQSLFPEDVRCKGISGSGERRAAIVNDKTVEKGEKLDLLLKTGQRVRVHCLDVKEKSVILEINGITKELPLRATLQ